MKNLLTSVVGCLLLVGGITAQSYQESIKLFRANKEVSLYTGDRIPLESEKDIKDLRYFDIDPKLKVQARVELRPDSKPFEMPTYSGITKTFIKYADVYFDIEGVEQKLSLYKNLMLAHKPIYQNHLFLPFMDLSNGRETYGGGRYIDLTLNEINNDKIIIDFNKAYNPWCAYSDGFNCPIPPVENRLEIIIPAGEKAFVGEKKKRE